MNKKFQPKHQQKEPAHHLDGQIARDDKALILPISLIKTTTNIRTELSNIEELAASIKQRGILQALVVAKNATGGLELVAGRRRLEAARMLNLKEVPVRIVETDVNGISIIRLLENIQRENLSPIEEINAVAQLVGIFDGNQDDLAQALGKNKSYVSKCLKAAEVTRDLKVSDPKLSKSMLLEVAYAPNPQKALEAIQSGKASSSKEVRKPSGAISGGRYVEGAIQFRENVKAGSFSLRINFNRERTPPGTRTEIIKRLEAILAHLKSQFIRPI